MSVFVPDLSRPEIRLNLLQSRIFDAMRKRIKKIIASGYTIPVILLGLFIIYLVTIGVVFFAGI